MSILARENPFSVTPASQDKLLSRDFYKARGGPPLAGLLQLQGKCASRVVVWCRLSADARGTSLLCAPYCGKCAFGVGGERRRLGVLESFVSSALVPCRLNPGRALSQSGVVLGIWSTRRTQRQLARTMAHPLAGCYMWRK